MNILILSIVFLTALLFIFLYYKKWKIRHIISFLFALSFMFLFSLYGSDILRYIWKGANASTLWVIMFFILYLGGGIIGSIPLLLDGTNKKELKKIFHLITLLFALGLIYVAIDNLWFGPFAIGPNSPYIGQDMCHLNPTYYAEDVFSGCQIQRLGIDPFGNTASFLGYWVFSALLIVLAILMLGAKKVEKVLFES